MSQDSVIRLKELLFDKESRELNVLTQRLEEVATRAGTDASFRSSVAATLEGALRDAEAANHRQVSDALAPLVVRTVRTEVEANSDALPGKLYPHIGVMVRDYVRSAIRDLMEDINQRLEDGLTKNRLSLRLRSWTTGWTRRSVRKKRSSGMAVRFSPPTRSVSGRRVGSPMFWAGGRGRAAGMTGSGREAIAMACLPLNRGRRRRRARRAASLSTMWPC